MDGDRVVVAVNRVKTDDALMSELIQSVQSKITEFLLQFSLKPNRPEATRELELLFDRIISNLKILQRGLQQIIESASGRPMIMPDKADIVALEEQFQVISDLLDRFEVFVQSLFLPILADTEESPARLLEGEGLQEAQARLRELMDNTFEIQRLAEVSKKS